MKKLIVGLFALAFALGANAATVNWHFDIGAVDCNFEDFAGTISLYFNDTLLGTTDFDGGVASTDLTFDFDNSVGGTVKAVAEITNFSDGAGTLEYSYFISQLPMEGYPDMDSSLGAVNSAIEAGISNDYAIDLSQTVADNGYTPVGPTPPVIPEPTTGLLVLLGVAGLALRRRCA